MSRLLLSVLPAVCRRRRHVVKTERMREADDEALVRDALGGESSSRRALADRLLDSIHREVVFSLIRWGVPKAELEERAGDFTQDVLVMLFENDGRELRRWDPERGRNLDSFVRLVTRRWVARKLGRKKLDVDAAGLDEGTVGVSVPSSSGAESRTELQWILQRLYADMTPRDVELFELLFVEEVEPNEVADCLGMTRGAVNAWSYRMRKQARAIQASDDARAERMRHHA